MATRDDLVTRIGYLLGTQDHLSTTEIGSILQTRYEVLYEHISWGKRPRDFTLATVAQTSSSTTTTASVTNGSATVTAIGTPFTSAMIGRFIQIGSDLQHFMIKDVPSSSSITLGDAGGNTAAWVGSTDSALSWRMFKNNYDLPSDADSIVTLAYDRPILEMDGGRTRLDILDPNRIATVSVPTAWLYNGQSSLTGYLQIELWPVPTSAVLLRGQYMPKAAILDGSSVIHISVPLLVFTTTADCAGMLFSKTGDESWQALQLFYERKANEIEPDILLREVEKTSPVRSIGRAPTQPAGTRGDYMITHHTDSLT